jgi:hypothetical protein
MAQVTRASTVMRSNFTQNNGNVSFEASNSAVTFDKAIFTTTATGPGTVEGMKSIHPTQTFQSKALASITMAELALVLSIPVSELTIQNLTTMAVVQYLCIKAPTFK